MELDLKTIQTIIGARLITEGASTDIAVHSACASDLMSDVLAFSASGSLLLTGLTSPQSIRTAEVADLSAICFCFDKTVPKETISLAEEIDLPLLVTVHSVFTASGLLHAAGLPGCRAGL